MYISEEKMRDIVLDSARFASFCQRVKMAYWKKWDGKRPSVSEADLDIILLHAWDDFTHNPLQVTKTK